MIDTNNRSGGDALIVTRQERDMIRPHCAVIANGVGVRFRYLLVSAQ